MTDRSGLAVSRARLEAVAAWLRERRYEQYPAVASEPTPPYGSRTFAFIAEVARTTVRDPLAVARALLGAVDPVTGQTLASIERAPAPRVLAQIEALPLGLDRVGAATLARRLADAMAATPGEATDETDRRVADLVRSLQRPRAPEGPPRSARPTAGSAAAQDAAVDEPPLEPEPEPARPVRPAVEGRAVLGMARVQEDMTFARDGVLQRGTRVPLLAWRSAHEAADKRSGGMNPRPLVVIGWLGRARFVPAESIERD